MGNKTRLTLFDTLFIVFWLGYAYWGGTLHYKGWWHLLGLLYVLIAFVNIYGLCVRVSRHRSSPASLGVSSHPLVQLRAFNPPWRLRNGVAVAIDIDFGVMPYDEVLLLKNHVPMVRFIPISPHMKYASKPFRDLWEQQ